jgi:hypothetical protein
MANWLAGMRLGPRRKRFAETRRDALKPDHEVQFEAASGLADETEIRRISGIFVIVACLKLWITASRLSGVVVCQPRGRSGFGAAAFVWGLRKFHLAQEALYLHSDSRRHLETPDLYGYGRNARLDYGGVMIPSHSILALASGAFIGYPVSQHKGFCPWQVLRAAC